MLTRSLLTSALPTTEPRRRLRRLDLRVLLRSLSSTRQHSQRIQERVEHNRQACMQRHAPGRKPNA
jgi:hypothetical protein